MKVRSRQAPLTATEPTIAAVATPPGQGGLAVVRLSGSEAFRIAAAILRSPAFARRIVSHRACHGLAVWPGEPIPARPAAAGPAAGRAAAPSPGTVLDEVVILPFRAPRSYTGEHTVEIHCHGGRLPVDRVLRACLAAGARAAGPGEFTRRAFLNGRLSLDRAEAVCDLIGAETDLAADAALGQLRGGLDRRLEALEGPLRELLADLEGSFELVDEEGVAVPRRRVLRIASAALAAVEGLLALAPAGRRLREGIRVVLAGSPNVGKSSLLNAMAGGARAIVDPAPGTTRDVVAETVERGGLRFRLCDTAGLRRRSGRIEREGIRRAVEALAGADVVLLLREAAQAEAMVPEATEPEARAALARLLPPEGEAPEADVLAVWTKADLVPPARRDALAARGGPATSAVTGEGVEALWQRLEEIAGGERLGRAVALGIVLNARHRDRLQRCREALTELAAEAGRPGTPDEVLAGMLALALADLGEVSGRVYGERLLDEVFSRFCVGK